MNSRYILSMVDQPKTLVVSLLSFGRLLRQGGVDVTVSELLNVLEGLRYISVTRKGDFKALLMASLITRREDIERFEQLFDLFWSHVDRDTPLPGGPAMDVPTEPGEDSGTERDLTFQGFSEELSETPESKEENLGWSLEEVDSEIDFGTLDQDQIVEIHKAIMRWSRSLAIRISRRYQRTERSSERMDLRRTLRRALKHGGILLDLAFKERKITKSKLVLLCDVSGSMDIYGRFFILFMYALKRALRQSEIFVFSTRLSRITQLLKTWRLEKALSNLKDRTLNWSGGTDIGNSLDDFCRLYGGLLLHNRTIVIIVSDGWDRGNPEVLRKALSRIRQRAQKILWLNPLLASPEYEPLCTGMKTALPFVDLLLPFYNLQSLKRLGRILEKAIVRSTTAVPSERRTPKMDHKA